MKVTLKKLHAIQMQVSDRISEINAQLYDTVNFDQDITMTTWEEYEEEQNKNSELIRDMTSLFAILKSIRVEQAKMNMASGVSHTLTSIAILERQNTILKGLLDMANKPVTKIQFNTKLKQAEETTDRILRNNVHFGGLTSGRIEEITSTIRQNKRTINSLREQLLEQNISTKLDLSDYVEETLRLYEII